jgi:hypothetical protein
MSEKKETEDLFTYDKFVRYRNLVLDELQSSKTKYPSVNRLMAIMDANDIQLFARKLNNFLMIAFVQGTLPTIIAADIEASSAEGEERASEWILVLMGDPEVKH